MYELFDFQCPFCRDFALHSYPVIDSLYVRTGKIRWVIVNQPLARHANAKRAAEIVMCAAPTGRFWDIMRLVLEYQDQWAFRQRPDSVLYGLASSIGLDDRAIAACVDKGEGRAELAEDARFVSAMGYSSHGVPTFLVGGRIIAQGAMPPAKLATVLDSVLAAPDHRLQ